MHGAPLEAADNINRVEICPVDPAKCNADVILAMGSVCIAIRVNFLAWRSE
jgi:hypothetical protein